MGESGIEGVIARIKGQELFKVEIVDLKMLKALYVERLFSRENDLRDIGKGNLFRVGLQDKGVDRVFAAKLFQFKFDRFRVDTQVVQIDIEIGRRRQRREVLLDDRALACPGRSGDDRIGVADTVFSVNKNTLFFGEVIEGIKHKRTFLF